MSKDLEAELRARALPNSRYLFFGKGKAPGETVERDKNTYYGYCTYCGKTSVLSHRPTHNQPFLCPNCNRVTIAKEDGRSTKNLYDYGGYNYIERVGDELHITHYYVAFDYRENKYSPIVCHSPNQRFEIAQAGVTAYMQEWYFNAESNKWSFEWRETKSVVRERYCDAYTEITPKMLSGCWLENTRLIEFLKRVSNCDINDVISYLTAVIKRPNIVNLVDDRYFCFALEYALGNKAIMNRIIDWKKNRPHEMLRTQKDEIAEISALGRRSMYYVLCYQRVRKQNQRLSENQIKTLTKIGLHLFDERPMREAIKQNRIPKALNYISAQENKCKRIVDNVLSCWRDYLAECDLLEYDLNDDSIRYPSDLMKAHERTMKLIKIKEDEAMRKKAEKRLAQLLWMEYNEKDYLIKPARNVEELKNEGKSLHHCVATYAKRHIDGKTAIFFVRKTAEPDKSLFTLELNEKKLSVCQNRGDHNCAPPEEIKQFVNRWLEWLPEEKARLKKQKKQKKENAA